MNREIISAVVEKGVNPDGTEWRIVKYEQDHPGEDTRELQVLGGGVWTTYES